MIQTFQGYLDYRQQYARVLHNPHALAEITDQTIELCLLAVRADPTTLQYVRLTGPAYDRVVKALE